jgi:zinc/manganese transport system substrate-binding protein
LFLLYHHPTTTMPYFQAPSFVHLPRRHMLALALALLGSGVHASDRLPVVASFSILGDLVKVVGGDRVSVTTLVGPDEDAHVFEPKPSDAKAIAQSKLLVVNGLGFEPWATKLARAAAYQGPTVVASQGVKGRTMADEHGHTEGDPHAWQNPNNVVRYVQNIATGLAKADPAGAGQFQANADAYANELLALDIWAKTQFAAIAPAKRKVITSHDAFGYFGAQYQISFLAPQGISTDAEPSAKGVARLIRQIQREKIRAVFVENMGNPKFIAQLSQDAGVTLGAALYADALSAPDQPGATYLGMVRHNVMALAADMRLN